MYILQIFGAIYKFDNQKDYNYMKEYFEKLVGSLSFVQKITKGNY